MLVVLATACSVEPEVVGWDDDGFGTGGTSAQGGTAASSAADQDGDSSSGHLDGSSSTGGGGFKYDVGSDTEGGGGLDCACGSELGFSYIWIANSQESTVSKINTMTLEEEGRYLTRSDGAGNPSRTSVSLSGRRAAVANRAGGVTAIWAREEFCDPMTNGVAGLQTSTGKADVLGWGDDDCVAWHTEFTGYTTQRPIAWIAGQQDPRTCDYLDEKLWTSGCDKDMHQNIMVHRLNGDTGVIEDTAEVMGFLCVDGGYNYGGYGGAVDADGNFWISNQTGTAKLARIDAETLETTIYPAPVNPYGITVDHLGRPWLTADSTQNSGQVPGVDGAASVARFDPMTETWALAQNHLAWGQSGIQEDGNGRMWVTFYAYDGDWNAGDGIAWIDVETLEVGPAIHLPGGGSAKGISVDLDGNVWSVWMGGNAIRYDPDSEQYESYDGLDGPYTYSDMTGWALQNATCKPAG